MLPTIDTIFGYFMAYLVVYAVLAGTWNKVICNWTLEKQEQLIEMGGVSYVMEYGMRLSNSWMCKAVSDVLFKPLVDIMFILLWPLTFPAQMITAMYYARRYLKKPYDELKVEAA